MNSSPFDLQISQIAEQGYCISRVELNPDIRRSVERREWNTLDLAIRKETLSGGVIFEELQKYAVFSQIEFIISIRSSLLEPDEDGIWHDDGSRVLAFSLSLTNDPTSIAGGLLEIRKKALHSNSASEFISTPSFGTIIVFATGTLGFEHRINRVTQGERIIIAGWCT